MPTAIAPILGLVEMPIPKTQEFSLTYPGGTLKMADGSVVHDLVDTGALYGVRLRWEFVTDAELVTIKSAYDTIKDNALFYVSVEAVAYNMTRPENGSMSITTVVTAGGQLAYHVEFELIGSVI